MHLNVRGPSRNVCFLLNLSAIGVSVADWRAAVPTDVRVLADDSTVAVCSNSTVRLYLHIGLTIYCFLLLLLFVLRYEFFLPIGWIIFQCAAYETRRPASALAAAATSIAMAYRMRSADMWVLVSFFGWGKSTSKNNFRKYTFCRIVFVRALFYCIYIFGDNESTVWHVGAYTKCKRVRSRSARVLFHPASSRMRATI